MSTLTVRLSNDTHKGLKELARYRCVSVNKLMEEFSTIAITQHDAETRFRTLAASARKNQGRYDKCRINQMKVHQNLTRIRKSTVSSGSCVLIRHITVLHWPGSAASFNIVLARRKQCGGIGTHRNLDPYSPRCLPRKHTELPQQPFNMDV